MGSKTQLLCDRLQETIMLLERVNEHYWADWLKVALSRIENDDFSGIPYLIAAYGGMGSFNDILIKRLLKFNLVFYRITTLTIICA